jgi:hypothetical protein
VTVTDRRLPALHRTFHAPADRHRLDQRTEHRAEALHFRPDLVQFVIRHISRHPGDIRQTGWGYWCVGGDFQDATEVDLRGDFDFERFKLRSAIMASGTIGIPFCARLLASDASNSSGAVGSPDCTLPAPAPSRSQWYTRGSSNRAYA